MEIAMRQDVTLREEYILKLWDNYIQDNLVEATPCKVAIYDFRTRRLIVASDRFYLYAHEIDQIANGMVYPDIVYRNGVTVQERNYKVVLADGKHGIYATDGEDGCTVCKTFSLLIVGIHDSRVKSDTCNEEIMKLGDYFQKLGL